MVSVLLIGVCLSISLLFVIVRGYLFEAAEESRHPDDLSFLGKTAIAGTHSRNN